MYNLFKPPHPVFMLFLSTSILNVCWLSMPCRIIKIIKIKFKNPMQVISAALNLQLPDICIKVGHGPAVLAAGAGCL